VETRLLIAYALLFFLVATLAILGWRRATGERRRLRRYQTDKARRNGQPPAEASRPGGGS